MTDGPSLLLRSLFEYTIIHARGQERLPTFNCTYDTLLMSVATSLHSQALCRAQTCPINRRRPSKADWQRRVTKWRFLLVFTCWPQLETDRRRKLEKVTRMRINASALKKAETRGREGGRERVRSPTPSNSESGEVWNWPRPCKRRPEERIPSLTLLQK